MSKFRGILPALVTPFDAEERFCPAPLEALLERVYSSGVHGVYVCGQTGEGRLQPVEQRKLVAEVAVRNSPPGRDAIIHVGCYRTADALELARHAGRIGAAAISSLPPDGCSFTEIRAYYQALAAVSELPVLVYYFPEICSGIASFDQILELTSIPNVVGLKFTDYNLYLLSLIRRDGYTIYNGRDEVLAAGLLMGANGGIGTFYNLVPGWFVHLFELSEAGRHSEARKVQDRINDLIRLTVQFPVTAAVKRMLDWSGIRCGAPLAPHRRLTEQEDNSLRQCLEAAHLDPAGAFVNSTLDLS
ncbi:MAG: dihydrodipicolinate synthase family protein [Bryobacteraceae bacterium]